MTTAVMPPAPRRSTSRRVLTALVVALLVWVAGLAALVAGYLTAVKLGPWLTPTEHDAVESAAVSDDGRIVTASYTYGACDALHDAAIVEQTAERVVVGITHKSEPLPGECIAIGYLGAAEFHLDEPLADRPFYFETDGSGGIERVRRIGDAWATTNEVTIVVD